jgi:hypothetical protein
MDERESLYGTPWDQSRRNVAMLALSALALPVARPAFARRSKAPATAEDEKFMRLALEEAALGDDPYYFGARDRTRRRSACARTQFVERATRFYRACRNGRHQRFFSGYGIDKIKERPFTVTADLAR